MFLRGSLEYFSSSLKLVDLIITKNELGSLVFFSQKTLYPYESFNSINDYYKPIKMLNKEHFNRLLYSSDSEGIQRSFKKFGKYNILGRKKLTLGCLKSDLCFLPDVSEKNIKITLKEIETNLLHFVSLAGFTS